MRDLEVCGEDIIKINFGERKGCEVMNRIHLAQDKDQW
jgi:hypothetical protein